MSVVKGFQLAVVTNKELTADEVEVLQQNIWHLLSQVRPDLVSENIDTAIEYIDIFESDEEDVEL